MGLKDDLKAMVELLCRLFPTLTVENAVHFIYLQMAAAVGLYPMANISEKQLKVIEHAELEHTMVDFTIRFEGAVIYFIQGLLN